MELPPPKVVDLDPEMEDPLQDIIILDYDEEELIEQPVDETTAPDPPIEYIISVKILFFFIKNIYYYISTSF